MPLTRLPGVRGFKRRRALLKSFESVPFAPGRGYFAGANGFGDPNGLQAELNAQAARDEILARNSQIAARKLEALTSDKKLTFRDGNRLADSIFTQLNDAAAYHQLGTPAYDRALVSLHAFRNQGLLSTPQYYAHVGAAVERLGGAPSFTPMLVSPPTDRILPNLSSSPAYAAARTDELQAERSEPTFHNTPYSGDHRGYVSIPLRNFVPMAARIDDFAKLAPMPTPPAMSTLPAREGILTDSPEIRERVRQELDLFLEKAKDFSHEEFQAHRVIADHNIDELTRYGSFDKRTGDLLKKAINGIGTSIATRDTSKEVTRIDDRSKGGVAKSPTKETVVPKPTVATNKEVVVAKADELVAAKATLEANSKPVTPEVEKKATGKSWPDDGATYAKPEKANKWKREASDRAPRSRAEEGRDY